MSVVYTDNRMEIYINGQPESSTAWTGDILQTSIDFMIGQVLPGNSSSNFKGVIDDVSIYNYALSSSEISDLYNQSTPIEDINKSGNPTSYYLDQNYPNPFNPTTLISYQLPVPSDVVLKIYDVLGKQVTTLYTGKQPAGNYMLQWDANNMASGIYYYKIEAGSFIDIKRMLLLR
jgi:hypothetical protein